MKWQKAGISGSIVFLIACVLIVNILPACSQPVSLKRSIVVLQPEDAAPNNSQKLLQRYFTGNDLGHNCSYYELRQIAMNDAALAGADVLKIISKTPHSRSQPCDGIEVAFYRSDNPYEAEQSFRWDSSRHLTWDDFRGPVRNGSSDNIVAETSCGIAIETSLARSRETAKVYVFNTFDKRKSWVRPEFNLTDILQHEQGHWNICELYTRKMQARFNAVRISGANLRDEVGRIYNAVSDEYVAYQELYEQETAHGTIDAQQARWTSLIAEELATSSVSKL